MSEGTVSQKAKRISETALMSRDALTGAYSRAAMQDHLQATIARACHTQQPVSLFVVDLDYFKSVNDAFGHTRGDQVLAAVVHRIRHLTNHNDLLFRYGGDEFVLMFPNTSRQQGLDIAQHLLDGVRGEAFDGNPPLTLSLSIGVATFPEEAQDGAALFEKADSRVCEAKRRGRAQIIAHDPTEPLHLIFHDEYPLIERQNAIQSLQSFLQALRKRTPGTFVVTGETGAGKSRFLMETNKHAQAHGWATLTLRGNRSRKTTPYSALYEPQNAWWHFPSPHASLTELTRSIEQQLQTMDNHGLFLIVDDLPELDWATLELVHHLFLASNIVPLALAYTADRESTRRMSPLEAPLQEAVELQPLSRSGVEAHLYNILQWNPPSDFLDWLHRETRGLPQLVEQGVAYLIRRGVLEREQTGYVFNRSYTQITLAEKLGVSTQSPPHNLPLLLTSFVGRDREIQVIKQLLEERRLITLIGAGGIGKTRLALQVAAEKIGDFRDGVFFIPLTSVASPDLLLPTTAQAIGFSFHNQDDPESQLLSYLRSRNMLLILDNFEHLVQDMHLLIQILQHAPEVKILVTSQERLKLQGEWVFEVPGLQYPQDDRTSEADSYSAVQFFIHSARRVQPKFTLPREELPDVIRICRLVGGMPLGIELAAAWIPNMNCRQIADEIERNLDFLTTTVPHVSERHSSLRAVCEHAWELLSVEERAVFRKLSVFRGGFRRAAATQIAAASLFTLSALVNKSLIHRHPSGRYELIEVLRKYAEAKLRERPQEHTSVLNHHCDHYAAFIQEQGVHLESEQKRKALAEIDEEIENIRAGWDWAVKQGDIKQLERYLTGLHRFFMFRGWFQAGEVVLAQAVERVRNESRETAGVERQRLVLLGKLLARQARLCHRRALYSKALSLLEESLGILRAQQQEAEVASVLNFLGEVAYAQSDYAKAQNYYEESLQIHQNIGNGRGAPKTLANLAQLAYTMGELEQARSFCEKSLEISTAAGDRRGIASTFDNLGLIAGAQGDYVEAKRCYRAGLDVFREIGDQVGIAYTSNNLSCVLYRLGEHVEAKTLCEEGLAICKQNMDRYGIAISLNNLGNIAEAVGDYPQARKLCQQALHMFAEINYRYGMAFTHNSLGNIACDMGAYGESREHYLAGLKIAMELQVIPLAVELLFGMAIVFSREGQEEVASELLAFTLQFPNIQREAKDRSKRLPSEQVLQLRQGLEQAQSSVSSQQLDEIVTKILGN